MRASRRHDLTAPPAPVIVLLVVLTLAFVLGSVPLTAGTAAAQSGPATTAPAGATSTTIGLGNDPQAPKPLEPNGCGLELWDAAGVVNAQGPLGLSTAKVRELGVVLHLRTEQPITIGLPDAMRQLEAACGSTWTDKGVRLANLAVVMVVPAQRRAAIFLGPYLEPTLGPYLPAIIDQAIAPHYDDGDWSTALKAVCDRLVAVLETLTDADRPETTSPGAGAPGATGTVSGPAPSTAAPTTVVAPTTVASAETTLLTLPAGGDFPRDVMVPTPGSGGSSSTAAMAASGDAAPAASTGGPPGPAEDDGGGFPTLLVAGMGLVALLGVGIAWKARPR